MNDNEREMLEMAARAVGEDVEWHENGSYFYRKSCNWPEEKGFFNPLHDDGEALRLAISLRMKIGVSDIAAFADLDDALGVFIRQPIKRLGLSDLSMLEAVRRAIVRAAAEIGRKLP